MSLVLGIIGIPVPDEVLMVFTGFLVSKGKLHFLPALVAAFAGSVSGMSVSFFVGNRLEHYIKNRRKNLARKIANAGEWFRKYGGYTIVIGYYVPGLRYLTAYFSGMSEMTYRRFLGFTVTGAAIWTTTFISLGYYLGNKWKHYIRLIEHYGENLLILVLVLFIMYLLYKIMCYDSGKRRSSGGQPSVRKKKTSAKHEGR